MTIDITVDGRNITVKCYVADFIDNKKGEWIDLRTLHEIDDYNIMDEAKWRDLFRSCRVAGVSEISGSTLDHLVGDPKKQEYRKSAQYAVIYICKEKHLKNNDSKKWVPYDRRFVS